MLGNPRPSWALRGLWTNRVAGKKVIPAVAAYRPEDFDYLISQIACGNIKPVIGHHYPLDQVAEAHRFVESGDKTGNLVINVISG